MRCNAWKDEVQNLLIFAGLFSAVVTAFVIESYKLLQPDTNDTIISLLSTIANGQNQTVTPSSLPFSQAPYSVRINVCWFISLILSPTTVLVGTIALQWLREHQLYVGYSGKEKLAILHMRREAAEAWFLPQVFAMLPLLLQAALVLFLIGRTASTLSRRHYASSLTSRAFFLFPPSSSQNSPNSMSIQVSSISSASSIVRNCPSSDYISTLSPTGPQIRHQHIEMGDQTPFRCFSQFYSIVHP
ncbi:hypothetical protein BDN70DRAFT_180815 [Pholiota conissans]|uniref:DUF6535 domain-containing protein n=1 Tax=Pholiota conissans TaxID=109636 RepID=A0A9P5Z9M5_9AGAR|nr:hypothetical protein BDN70DRAFT_180815 [Pholiota conissans]